MNAYVVYEADCMIDGAQVVFATSAGRAKAQARGSFDCDYIDLRAHREPVFDEYIDRRAVPAKALYDKGWWMRERCSECGLWVRVNQDDVDADYARVEFDECGDIKSVLCHKCIER